MFDGLLWGFLRQIMAHATPNKVGFNFDVRARPFFPNPFDVAVHLAQALAVEHINNGDLYLPPLHDILLLRIPVLSSARAVISHGAEYDLVLLVAPRIVLDGAVGLQALAPRLATARNQVDDITAETAAAVRLDHRHAERRSQE